MSSRAAILGSIRRHLHRDALPAGRAALLQDELARPRRPVVPGRGQVAHADQIELFAAMATEVAASVARLARLDGVPQAVTEFLAAHGLTGPVRVAPALRDLPWPAEVTFGPAEPADAVSVTPVFAGVAETGTLVLLSDSDSPTSLNFLPDTHIAVLPAVAVMGVYEDAWDRLRAQSGALPRTVNLITGPSRTGDIEQTIQLGAHGPRRLHILLIDDQPAR